MVYIIFGIIFIALDQLTKVIIRAKFPVGEGINVIGEFFKLTHIENQGAAFSSFSGERAILIALPVIMICGCIFYCYKHRDEHWSFYLSITMVIAGGIGNLIDRVLFGSVTDMLDFSIFPPVFNIADIGVTVGCALLIISILFADRRNKNNGK